MPREAILLSILFFFPAFFHPSYGFLGADLQPEMESNPSIDFTSGIFKSTTLNHENSVKRYLIMGSGSASEIKNTFGVFNSITSDNGFFSVALLSEDGAHKLRTRGYDVFEDFMVDLHSGGSNTSDGSRIGEIVGSDKVREDFGYTGKGITVAIVDTGVDFSNPDIQHSLARDKNNHPIMLDADGQGIILTNATFFALIDENNLIRNYTKELPENITSSVYRTKKGVFLDLAQGGKGTTIPVYNSFFPQSGTGPIFNGTLGDDMKIGSSHRDYIVSKSGVYHLGVMYQGALQGPFTRLQVVPVLVVDSLTAGVYDTIIPDMSSSWEDYTRFDLPSGEKPNYDFDFTDETPIRLGTGKEFLVYDSDDDGKSDYSAGTVGARVLDVYGVIEDKTTEIDKRLNAINGTLLPPMDDKGEFFGVMTDFVGHGTSSAASITSNGVLEYNIYNDTNKYTITGVAPDTKIIPVKALWFGDTTYAWLWLAGFDNANNKWEFNGAPRADIISNSWGISNFPSLKEAPGLDILSLIVNILATPKSIDQNFPGITIVSSAGNSGHGYGTMGMPNAASYGIAVGATTNNVFVGYQSFKDQPRFGNTTDHFNHVVDFSSRGPGIIGDPKPDVMSIGAYSFTPAQVTKLQKDSKKEPFSMFGGTSMAAPLVAGSISLLMESLNDKQEIYDPFKIKNILLSTATDLQNDPLTQGAGLANPYDAIRYVKGEGGIFIVHNDATFSNIKKILDGSLNSINSSSFGVDNFRLIEKNFPQSNWFAGHLSPGERSTSTFTIENPTSESLVIKINPEIVKLIKKDKFEGTTKIHTQDPILNETGTYTPNFIRLADVKEYKELSSFYNYSNPIPEDSSLLVLNVNFPFDQFMNKTEDVYANDIKISSLYLYDWTDNNNDTKVSSDELSLVNRAGSWGTVQEMRVSLPNEKFEDIPMVGVYPVPSRYSFWQGDTNKNSTSMDYTLSASYYKKDKWNLIWLDNNEIEVPPNSIFKLRTTLVVPLDYQTGVYQGFLRFDGGNHTVNVPVTFGVKEKIQENDSLVLIKGQEGENILFGNGYVKGAFDMVNRYMAGDWRQYYFDIEDPDINTASIELSWENDDSNLSVFVIDPLGNIAQSNVAPGVFGHFNNWPSSDWLGTTPFSQGGGFFPVKNKDDTSTVLYVPINQTGTYTMMTHSTLFGGNETTEPFSLAAKFTNINSRDIETQIIETKTNNKSTSIAKESDYESESLTGEKLPPNKIEGDFSTESIQNHDESNQIQENQAKIGPNLPTKND